MQAQQNTIAALIAALQSQGFMPSQPVKAKAVKAKAVKALKAKAKASPEWEWAEFEGKAGTVRGWKLKGFGSPVMKSEGFNWTQFAEWILANPPE